MPPKKTAATATKEKAIKNGKAPKGQDKTEEELPQKKNTASKEKATKNAKAPKGQDKIEEEIPQKKKTAASKGTAKNPVETETENGTETKKRAAKATTTKKQTAATRAGKIKEEEIGQGENENATATTTNKRAPRAKKVESQKEVPEKSKLKKKPTGAKNAKAANSVPENDTPDSPEEPEAPPKTQKRKAVKSKEEAEPEKKPKTAPRTNATATDWASINFECPSKTPGGKAPNFHITSWNVDGVRAWLKKGGLDILKHDQPDILCLQETKCSDDKLPEEITNVEGYEAYWCSSEKDGYAGVGVLTKTKPLEVTSGIESEEHDDEGRCITAEYDKFYLVNVYVPNAGRKLITLPKRLDWNEAFKAYIKKLDAEKPVIICGDMNVAHNAIDLANPKTNTKNAGFTVEERDGMTDFLGDGYIDTFRELYPDKEKAYTFWTYMANARTKNVGWRLDYFIVSERFKDNVCDNIIYDKILGSDHCPITLYVNL